MKKLLVVGSVTALAIFAAVIFTSNAATVTEASGGAAPCTSTVIVNSEVVALVKQCTNRTTGVMHVTGFVLSNGLSGQVAVCHQDKTGDTCSSVNPITQRSGFTPGANCIGFDMGGVNYDPERIDLKDTQFNVSYVTGYLSTFYNRRVEMVLRLLHRFEVC